MIRIILCCPRLYDEQAGSGNAAALLGVLNIPVQGANVPIGLDCTPLSVLAVAGNSCNTQTVCCENNNFKGVVAIGCTPINVNL
ncbi:hypothetical protein D9615_009389 [Tricholomella constricta]|uniref:Hydrophobin n=1 Tax=Tricholomella constricta TaxID=117010 RepID=A0A8H5H2D6_9AGAR|nr:hypothetical protein D9615_009389 [Tricholomella constricta]